MDLMLLSLSIKVFKFEFLHPHPLHVCVCMLSLCMLSRTKFLPVIIQIMSIGRFEGKMFQEVDVAVFMFW